MPGTIDFYFEFLSPYSFLASHSIDNLARRHGRTVRWLPIDIVKVWSDHGVLEAYGKVRNLKRSFIRKDSAMIARMKGITIAPPPGSSADMTLAKRVVHHVNARSVSDGAAVARAFWSRFFIQSCPISTTEDLVSAAPELLKDEDVQEAGRRGGLGELAYQAASIAAQTTGCFGVPWYVVDGETFFGQDRHETLEWWLQHEAASKTVRRSRSQ